MLTATSACSTSAFLEPIDQIGARTLPRRIETHEQAGDQRYSQRKNEHGPLQCHSAFERNVLTSHLWDDRYRPERQTQSDCTCDYAYERTFEYEQPHDAASLRSECHAQCDLAPAAGEAHQQQVCNVAASDKQHGAYGGQQRQESRT